ncbi:MAG: M48 family metallopeptidase [Desulfobacteraceae bacterium]|nr:M48 family metallopeptidase [Desulfobacteraceae bacterium]
MSADQLPDIHAKVMEAANKLGLTKIPEAYVMQAGGALNAFATKFIGRNFVVIYADLLEACSAEGREAEMIIGHEIGHLALGHLKWLTFLAPARLLPWIGPAYSRACEYSCDRCGADVANDINSAARGIAILAAGGKLAPRVNLNAFVAQTQEISGFWSSIYELNASHPFLPKRVAALINWKKPGTVTIPGRNPLAYPLAPFLGFGGVGVGATPLVMVAIIGIMAAIAVPQFNVYRERAKHARNVQSIDQLLKSGQTLAVEFKIVKEGWPCSVEELNAGAIAAEAERRGWKFEVDCETNYVAIYYDEGKHKRWRAIMLDSGETQEGSAD